MKRLRRRTLSSFKSAARVAAMSVVVGLLPTTATLALSAEPAAASVGTINSIAGTGTNGFSGDGGQATGAQIAGPWGEAYDITGNLYFADEMNYRVRKISATGVISTVAGDGTRGFSGDGGPATSARVDPWGIAVSSSGSVYIADRSGRIRKIDSSGTITTVAGGGASVADGVAGTDASIPYPRALTLDSSGNLYIGQINNSATVRKLDASTGLITTIATYPSVKNPEGLAVDAQRNVYVADEDNFQVERIDHATGALTVVAGNGSYDFSGNTVTDGVPATSTTLKQPMGVALDGAGNLFVADKNSYRARRVEGRTGIISTVAGNGTADFSGDGGPATAASLRNPVAVAIDPIGNVSISDIETYFNDDTKATEPSEIFPHHIRQVQGIAVPGVPGVGPVAPPPPPAPPTGGPITPGESYGNGSNPSEVCLKESQGCAADPVDTGTGNFSHTWNDIAVPGRGIPLSLSRTYNSGTASTDSAFGFGWSFDYGFSLSINAPTVTVNQENASQVTFTDNGSGVYTAPPRVQATLVKNQDGTFTFTRRAKEIFSFDSSGNLTSEKDLSGYVTNITHPDSSTLKVTDPANRSLTFTYTGTHITGVSDPTGRTESFIYDGSGNLTDVIDVGSGHSQFAYDTAHRILTMRAPKFYGDTTTTPTPVVTNAYDSQGRVTSQTDQLGRTTTFDYTSVSGSTKITDPKGNVSLDTYQYGLRTGHVTGYGTTQAATSTFRYDPNTVGLTSATDPNGHMSTFTYDANGNRTSSTDALGRSISATFDALNDQTASTDQNGVVTTATYDTSGNLLSTSRPLNGSQIMTTYTYGDSPHPGDVTKVTDPNGHSTNVTYDTYGNVSSSTDAVGDKATFTYNTEGWLLTKVDPKGNVPGGTQSQFTTTYDHDNFGRVTATKDPLWTSTNPTAHRTTTTYDANGNQTATTDGNGRTTSFSYDAANEATTTTKPDNTTQSTSYWPDGTLKTQTDGNGHITSYAYDQLARLTSTTDPLNRATSYSYDPAGNMTNKVDPGGTCVTTPSGCTTYSYDAANRLTNVGYSDSTPAVSYVYDAKGQRTSMTDGTGTTTTAWDSLGRLTSQTNGAGVTTAYGYDNASNLTSIGYPGSNTVTRTYDAANRFTAVTDWLGHTNRFTYDPNSNQTSTLSANGVANAATFDNANQLNALSIAKGSAANISYTRNGSGQLTSSASTGALTQPAENYGYDQNSRLTSVNASNLTYDNANNITKTQDGATQAYDNANELTSRTLDATTTTYGDDQKGNRTSQVTGSQTTSLGYDLANRLKAFTSPTTSAAYSYDGDGNRTSKTVGSTNAAFVYDQAEGLSQVLSDGTNSYLFGPGGMPVEQINGTTVTYLHQDQLGSTRVLTDQNRSVSGTYSYNAYGTTSSHTGTNSTPLQFAGQYNDAESGLYWMRARYYDPTTAQFVNVDPLVAHTATPYGYALDNPSNFTDPLGMYPLEDWNKAFNEAAQGIQDVTRSTLKTAANTAVKIAAVPPYFDYYLIYRTQSSIGNYLPGSWNVALCNVSNAFLYADEGYDILKRATGSDETTNDENVNGGISPLHVNGIDKKPGDPLYWYLPGVHTGGARDLYPAVPYPWGAGVGPRNNIGP